MQEQLPKDLMHQQHKISHIVEMLEKHYVTIPDPQILHLQILMRTYQ